MTIAVAQISLRVRRERAGQACTRRHDVAVPVVELCRHCRAWAR